MASIFLSFADVPDTNKLKLQRAVSSEYLVRKIYDDPQGKERYEVYTVWNGEEMHVAFVLVVDGKFEFKYDDEAFSINYFLVKINSLKKD